MKYFFKFLKIVYSIYAIILFAIIMLLLFPFAFLISLFKEKGKEISFKILHLLAYVWFFLIGMPWKRIYEKKPPKNKQFIFISNHTSYIDIPTIIFAITQSVQILGKEEMQRIPIFGLIYRSIAVTVDRANLKNRTESYKHLVGLVQSGKSVALFPEGTFNETTNPLKDFYSGAFRLAIETQTPIQPILLLDTVKRLHYSSALSFTPGINRMVYLSPIDIAPYSSIQQINELKMHCHHIMETKLKEYRDV